MHARDPHEMRLSSSLRSRGRGTTVLSPMDTYDSTSAAPATTISPARPPRILVIDRDRDTEVSVIMFTAFTGDLESDGRRLGFTILRKPLDIEALRRAVRAAIE